MKCVFNLKYILKLIYFNTINWLPVLTQGSSSRLKRISNNKYVYILSKNVINVDFEWKFIEKKKRPEEYLYRCSVNSFYNTFFLSLVIGLQFEALFSSKYSVISLHTSRSILYTRVRRREFGRGYSRSSTGIGV